MPPFPSKANLAPDVLFSVEALRRAWQLVRGNGPSPGSDGVTLETFAQALDTNLAELRQSILSGTYRPQPLRRFYVEKASGKKKRPLSLWTVRDRVAQRVVHDYLTPILEGSFLPCSYGFRPGRSPELALQAVVRGPFGVSANPFATFNATRSVKCVR